MNRPPETSSRRVVVALGGNALVRPGEEGTWREQHERVAEVAAALAAAGAPPELVVTHGNGPQVGRLLLRSDLCAEEVPPDPLDVAVAETQGGIGMLLALALRTHLRRPVAALLTHVVVSPDDVAFAAPAKPVGRFYTRREALDLAARLGWVVREDPGRGWRRVVASPRPRRVLEVEAIRRLLEGGHAVVACGGGGVPVFERRGHLVGAEAVVDKDLASALLARSLGADALWILTGVDAIRWNWRGPGERVLAEADPSLLRRGLAEGQFPQGSMGPKIEAALAFLEDGGREVLVTSPEALGAALEGRAGTWVRRG